MDSNQLALLTTPASLMTPDEHDAANNALGRRFVRALAAEKALLDHSLPASAPFVLAAIMYHQNESIGRAYPSYAKIQEITGYSSRTIETAILALKAGGYIFTERRAPFPGRRALTLYGLCQVRMIDIDAVVTAAVNEIKRQAAEKDSQAGTAENCGPRNRPRREAGTAKFCTAGTAEKLQQKPSSDGTHKKGYRGDDETKAAREGSSSGNLVTVVSSEVVFDDSEDAARFELLRLGYAEPNQPQIDLLRGEIVACMAKFVSGCGYSSPAAWFRARFAPRLTTKVRVAANAVPETGNSVADAVARRLAQNGGVQ